MADFPSDEEISNAVMAFLDKANYDFASITKKMLIEQVSDSSFIISLLIH